MTNDTVWQNSSLTQAYLTGVRGAIPLAQQQIDVMLRLVRAACPQPRALLDLGCGDGILGQAILQAYEGVETAVFIDFSAPMLAQARQRLAGRDATFLELDYGQAGWQHKMLKATNRQSSIPNRQFDVVVSGYSIHHQTDERKREIYGEIFGLLRPGGIFINIEHVSSASKWIEQQFDELFVDSLEAYAQRTNMGKTRDEVAQEFYYRPDKAANMLAPVEAQCQWLRDIGYSHVDCYLKIFELAVFGGVKASEKVKSDK